MIDTFDYLIENYLEVEDQQTLKNVCEKIIKIIPYKVFLEMRMKTQLLCTEVIKVDPHKLITTPYKFQTEELCNLAMELSNGRYFCFVNPQVQTYNVALRAVKFDGKM